jgi:hypothetical protein
VGVDVNPSNVAELTALVLLLTFAERVRALKNKYSRRDMYNTFTGGRPTIICSQPKHNFRLLII